MSEQSKLTSRSFAQRIGAPVEVTMPGSHLGLTWREIDRDDLPHLVTLLGESSDSPLGILPANETTVRHWFDEISAHPAKTEMIGGWDSRGCLQAVGIVRVNVQPVSELQADVSAIVSSEWAGRGIGRALLGWQDCTARNLMLDFPTDLPVSIRATVNQDNAERRRLVAAGGFAPVGEVTHMAVETSPKMHEISTSARSHLAERGLELQPFDEAVGDELRTLHNRLLLTMERYQPMSAPAWEAKLARVDKDFSYLLTSGDSLVGYTLAEHVPQSSLLRVYFYGIERSLRRQGVGTDVLVSVLGPAYDAGIKRVSAPVIGKRSSSFEALSQFGFEPVLTDVVYSIDL